MRVWTGGFMVDTLVHYNFGPNVVFETLELYISLSIYIYTYFVRPWYYFMKCFIPARPPENILAPIPTQTSPNGALL